MLFAVLLCAVAPIILLLKLSLNPNILWQYDSCVVANDSHSKIDEFDDKLKALAQLIQSRMLF